MRIGCSHMGIKIILINLKRQSRFSFLNQNIAEIRIQTASHGPGVIVPVAFVRQQDQEQNENGRWIANNYNIFIYPLYDCNLYELHQDHYDGFTEKIFQDILNQCLRRKRS